MTEDRKFQLDPETRERISELGEDINRTMEPMRKTIDVLNDQVRGMHQRVHRILAPFADLFAEMRRDTEFSELGWVPHPKLPLDEWMTEKETKGFDTDSFIVQYFRDEWGQLRKYLAGNSAFEILGEDTKRTYIEALEAHSRGLYRCVPRTIFGEIELAAQLALDGVSLDTRIGAKLAPVWKIVDELPAYLLPKEMGTFVALMKIQQDAYADTRRRSANSKLPNRNEFIHGYGLKHATERDSINSLLIADLMFRLLATIRTIARDEENDEDSQ